MTAAPDVQPEQRSETALGARERRRLEQQRRARRRYRQVGVIAAAAIALVLAVTGVFALAGSRSGDSPAPELADTATAAAPADGIAVPADEAAADEVPAGAADERVRLQLLNGVGAPGIADRVENRLPEEEFRVVVADNAPAFDVRKTRLLVYDDDPASLAAADRLREVLGVGTISVSRQPQSVVDVTVIIGRDLDGS